VHHLGQVFAGHAHAPRNVVVASGEDHFACLISSTVALHEKCSVNTPDVLHRFILVNVQLVMASDATIVFQRFVARRLFVHCRHGDVADFEQLRRGEEDEVRRVVEERVNDAALFEDQGAQAHVLAFDGAGKPGGSCANDDDIHHAQSIASTVG
jgi:hypothetical protein